MIKVEEILDVVVRSAAWSWMQRRYLQSGPVCQACSMPITGARAELRTDAVMRTASAKDYSQGHRLYGLVEGRLLWTFDMAAVGQPLGNHLAATLSRADATE